MRPETMHVGHAETIDVGPAAAPSSGVHEAAIAGIPGGRNVPIQHAKVLTSTTAPAPTIAAGLVEHVPSEVLALVDEMASSEGVPRSFVVSAAIKALYHSLAWR